MSSRDHLENSLSVFIDSPSGWDFFVGIKDYVQYILENPDLKAHVEHLQKERESLLKAEAAAELETKKELLISLNKIREIVTKNKLEDIPEITKILNDIESYQTNRLQISGKFSDNLDHFLFEICRNTPEDKRFVLFKRFINENPEQKNIYGNFSFSSTLEDRRKLTKHIEHRDKIELWSDWIRLEKVPLFMETDNIYKVELKDGDTKYAYELIKARVEYDQNGSVGEFTKIIPEYKGSVLKVHAFLTRKIDQAVSPKEEYHELGSTKHKESIVTIVKEAKLRCLDIRDGGTHRELRDYWLNTRRVLDVICNKLYGGLIGGTKKEVSVSLKEFFANRVSERKQGVIFETLDHLVQWGVISSKVPSSDDLHIVSNGVFYNDNALLVIQDAQFLEDLRQKVATLTSFIEEDGKKRFPLHYPPQKEELQRQLGAVKKYSAKLEQEDRIATRAAEKLQALAQENLRKNSRTKEKEDKRKPILQMSGRKWSEVSMYIHGNGDVKIIFQDGETHEANWQELGLTKTQENKVVGTVNWDFLYTCAMNRNTYPLQGLRKADLTKIEQRKCKVKQLLMEKFDTHEDPFTYDPIERTYLTRFKVHPAPTDREKLYSTSGILKDDGDDKFGDIAEQMLNDTRRQ